MHNRSSCNHKTGLTKDVADATPQWVARGRMKECSMLNGQQTFLISQERVEVKGESFSLHIGGPIGSSSSFTCRGNISSSQCTFSPVLKIGSRSEGRFSEDLASASSTNTSSMAPPATPAPNVVRSFSHLQPHAKCLVRPPSPFGRGLG